MVSMMRTRASAGHFNFDKNFVGLRLQRVPGQDGDGFAENFVAGGTATAQIVVVEGGQVVVNQGIGVQHFQRCAEFLDAFGQRSGDHASGLDAEHGAQALAAGEHAVAHGLVNGDRMLGLERDEAVERGVGQALSLFECFLEHEGVSITRRLLGRCFGTARKKDARRRPLTLGWIYAAAPRDNAMCRWTEAITSPTSSVGHTSLAPASSAAIHISSSGMRWVQTMGKVGKVAVQTFDIGQAPELDVENHGFGIFPGDGVPQFFVGPGYVHRKVRAESTGQGAGNFGVFLENNNTLSHTSPDLQPRT